ncbi:hypothetical protein BACCIP111895_01740 [Neobacillus rhizosphaerae]|uniref:Uncharacterized protein n=1 Tax=Neobacillus rhizosphaerae TaxID=2880965 RepID=A0ABM9EPQ7_9BACI|nr:hypothetical protein BACCIP111895_01740 [Neobacillus rhizosphaerae]
MKISIVNNPLVGFFFFDIFPQLGELELFYLNEIEAVLIKRLFNNLEARILSMYGDSHNPMTLFGIW